MKTASRTRLAGWVSVASLMTALIAGPTLQAQTFTILHSFGSSQDGANSRAGLIRDSVGNLYGTTWGGGAHAAGSVFELSPVTGGGWNETVLYSFAAGPSDGANPTAGLVRDGLGNLYGTTNLGGTSGAGTVFKLSPSGGGWTETVLYSFTGGTDGGYPFYGSLVLAGGYLYGTTYIGGDPSCINGSRGCGVVFRVKASGGHESVLHSFTYNPPGSNDGAYPFGGLVRDSAGNLYGVTNGGSTSGDGIVFELSPAAGSWNEKILYTFSDTSPDGINSFAGLVRDKAGNLYGTTSGVNFIQGGIGTVFELDATGKETLPHVFTGPPSDGGSPMFNVILDSKGNLYGTTPGGGTLGVGVIFKVSPVAGGGWKETVLYNFTGGADGSSPQGTLLRDSAGNLYGTTYTGGSSSGGTAFKFHP